MALVKMGLFCKGFVTSYHLVFLRFGPRVGGSIPSLATTPTPFFFSPLSQIL